MIPNCVISTFGPRHIMGVPLPAASRGNSGSQPRLESPDQEAQVPLTTCGCWGGNQRILQSTLCILQPMLTMKSECLGMIQTERKTGVQYLRNNPYCQGLACKFIPNLAKTYGRAGSILLLSQRQKKNETFFKQS